MRIHRWATAGGATVAVLAFAACGLSTPQTPAQSPRSPAESSQAVQRFVAFRQPAFVLVSIGTPTEPPIAVGSTLAADLLSSSNPEIVSVDGAGYLIANMNGTAIIRGSLGATLQVVVNAVKNLKVAPDRLELLAGTRTTVGITGDGQVLDAGNIRWETTAPNTAAASGPTVYAGYTTGTATLTARSGSAFATLSVVVREPDAPLRLSGRDDALKLGSVERFVANVPSGAPLEWTSSNPVVLEAMRDGAFYARRRGSSQICARSGTRHACKRVAVR